MKNSLTALGLLLGLFCVPRVFGQASQPDGGHIRSGTLPNTWDSGGPKCMEMPEWQVHEYNADLYILRQSGCTDFEKPFVFLLFGSDRALLLDTGSRRGNLAPQIQLTVHRWLARNNRGGIPLIVAHTHSHSDHVAGDAALQALNDPSIPITYVPPTVEANQKIFGITRWPDDTGAVDLGNRIIDVLAIPGHDGAAIALYDRQTAILFTGDSVYPGRLYIRDLSAFQKSNQRMLDFTDGKIVAHILGNHIEQTRTPYLDYPVGTIFQPNEHEWALSRGVLFEIQAGLEAMHGTPQRVTYRDFSLWPAGPLVKETDESRAAFKQTQKQQLDHMWDQSQP
ncbi:MAG TPA: MBL fold metallo-hydrolase [Steroidobacteraceae bacterium]|jgi:hydroxyacylglutathione hydrolase|nr:MBL fold metallo-hydrolase [Steroidobacteraceae bacterium]